MILMRILSPGVRSSLQDRGRPGFEALGVSESGAADRLSFHLVNWLLGNPPNSPAVEILFGGFTVEILAPCTLAVGGAEAEVTLDETPCANWSRFRAEPGQILRLGPTREGQISYLGVAGAFDGPRWFGSVSVNPRENLGTVLQRGDLLEGAGERSPVLMPGRLSPSLRLRFTDRELILRYLPGYQEDRFDRHLFERQRFTVSSHYDKMGYRLKGVPVRPERTELISEGICFGAIQITYDGDPIVLLNERQTLGGYPKIGSVLPPDCWRLVQYGAGTPVRFRSIGLEESRRVLAPFLKTEENPWFPSLL